eukprot:4271076-Alexandrium_andersonii.AAC.1
MTPFGRSTARTGGQTASCSWPPRNTSRAALWSFRGRMGSGGCASLWLPWRPGDVRPQTARR